MQNILLHSYMQHNIMPHAAVVSGGTIQYFEMLSSSTSRPSNVKWCNLTEETEVTQVTQVTEWTDTIITF